MVPQGYDGPRVVACLPTHVVSPLAPMVEGARAWVDTWGLHGGPTDGYCDVKDRPGEPADPSHGSVGSGVTVERRIDQSGALPLRLPVGNG